MEPNTSTNEENQELQHQNDGNSGTEPIVEEKKDQVTEKGDLEEKKSESDENTMEKQEARKNELQKLALLTRHQAVLELNDLIKTKQDIYGKVKETEKTLQTLQKDQKDMKNELHNYLKKGMLE